MDILGHRGTGITMRHNKAQEEARRRDGTPAPENTLKAFELALKGGADGLELDVYRTKDGDLAVIHDDQLGLHIEGIDKRRHKNFGLVSEHSMAELRSMKVGDGETVPSLRDVFALASRYGNPVLNIEVAGKNTYEIAYRQAKQSGYPMDRIVFSSFEHGQLEKLRALDESIKIGLLFHQYPLLQGQPRPNRKYLDAIAAKVRPTSLHVPTSGFTAGLRDYARQKGLEIFIWTAHEKHPAKNPSVLNLAKRYKNAPDIHLITDYPVQIKNAL